MTARRLKAVDSEPPARTPAKPTPARKPGRPKSLKNAANSSEREMLVILRDKLAGRLDDPDTPPHAVGRLVADFLKVDRNIRDIDRRADDAKSDAGVTNLDDDDEWDDDEV